MCVGGGNQCLKRKLTLPLGFSQVNGEMDSSQQAKESGNVTVPKEMTPKDASSQALDFSSFNNNSGIVTITLTKNVCGNALEQ